MATLALYQGKFLWETEAPINPDTGELTEAAHPWARQSFNDLSVLAVLDEKYAAQWSKQKWWSIYSDEFLHARVKRVQSYVCFDLFCVFQRPIVLPNMLRATLFKPSSAHIAPQRRSAVSAMEKLPDTWMQIPGKREGPASSGAGKQKQTRLQNTTTTSSSSSSSSLQPDFRQAVIKNVEQLDRRIRELESISEDAIQAPAALPEVQAALAEAQVFAATPRTPGQRRLPAHAYIFAAFLKEHLKQCKDPDLKNQVLKFIQENDNPKNLLHKVKFFTVRLQHEKTKAVITVHVTSELTEMWWRIRETVLARGGEEFFGTPPRGPWVRKLLTMA